MLEFIFGKKKVRVKKNFFDYPSREKKKIIIKAAKEANEMQLKLAKKYNLFYCRK